MDSRVQIVCRAVFDDGHRLEHRISKNCNQIICFIWNN